MRTRIRRTLVSLAVLAVSVSGAHSQTQQNQSTGSGAATTQSKPNAVADQGKPGEAQGKAPVIRTTTRLVQVSVVVTDKKGQPITGLKKEDFTVLDGKEPQTIAIFSAEAPAVSSQPVRTLPPNIFTNRHDKLGEPPGSNTIIFFDALNTGLRQQAFAREQVLKFLKTIQPQDHFAIYALANPGQVEILHEFTQDDAALVKAINDYTVKQPEPPVVPFADAMNFAGVLPVMLPLVPQDSLVPRTSEDRAELEAEYARMRLYPEIAALIGIANHVASIPGRKNLIWISAGLKVMGDPHLPNKVRLSELGYRLEKPEYAEDEEGLLRAVVESCNAANTVMYGVDAHGVQVATGMDPNRRSGLGASSSGVVTPQTALRASQGRLGAQENVRFIYRMLADETGGTAFYGNNDLTEGMAKAFDDGRYAYTIGYYPDHGTWDGSFRKIQIKVSEEGVHARYRDGYYATADNAGNEGEKEKKILEAASSPLDSSALSMMVSGRHVQGPTTRELEFQAGVDVAQLLLDHAGGHWKGGIDLAFVQRDDKLEVIAADKKHVDLDFTDAQYQSLLTVGAIFERHLTLLPEAKDVRAIVRDTGSGQIGTVTVPLKTFFPVAAGAAAGQMKHP